MLSIAIKTGAVILITATAVFDQLPNSQNENTNNQTIKETIKKPEATSNKSKPLGDKQSTRYLRKKSFRQNKKKTAYSGRRIRVSGYLGDTFVYGEVIPLKNGGVEGYIYHPNNSKTYVYGEQSNDRINLYDTNGNLYRMLNQ